MRKERHVRQTGIRSLCKPTLPVYLIVMALLLAGWRVYGADSLFGPERIIVDRNDSAKGARTVCAADVDGDGDVDVLSASHYDDKITWHESDGRNPPAFTAHTIDICDGANWVDAGDLNGDGNLDVVAAASVGSTVAWYESDGGQLPTFTKHTLTTDTLGPRCAKAADMDGDGDLDVLMGAYEIIAWYENDGMASPTFTERIITESAADAETVHAADLDGDGDMDLLAVRTLPDQLSWYENDGAAQPSFIMHTLDEYVFFPGYVDAADLDGDGDLDPLCAAMDPAGPCLFWYENDGMTTPTFTERLITTEISAAWAVDAADMDGDGDLDVLATSLFDYEVIWCENDGMVPPSFTPQVITSFASSPWSVHAADVDSDGDMDVLSTSQDDNTVAWYENDGGDPPTFYGWAVTAGADGAKSVYSTDLDGDGDLDLLSASSIGNFFGGHELGKIAWYESNGQSPPAFTPRSVTIDIDGAMAVYAADLDDDGDQDVLSASIFDDRVAWYENLRGSPLRFTAHTITEDPYTGWWEKSAGFADGAISVHAGDLDGDGDLDVLSASHHNDKIAWYKNDGLSPPSFTPNVITEAADGAFAVHAADLDADGDLDVLSASEFDDKIAWYENDGLSSPSFTTHVITVDADGATAVYAADLDGDGDLDVLSAAFNNDQIAWYENDGLIPPGFTEHVITEDPDGPEGLQEGFADGAIKVSAADVDGDGDLDVLSASRENNTIAWYENQGGIPPVFAPQTITTSAGGAWSVNVGDLDRDGDLDVVSAAFGDDTIAWYENLSPLQIVYDFLFDYDEWTSVSVPAVFSPPLFDWEGDPGYLKIASTVNTNCFGYWASPQDAIPSSSEYLYRACFRILSDVTDPALVPQIRVRANSSNLQQYDVLSIESAGDGGASPAVAGKYYDLFFVPPANASFASIAFDLLNFNPDDAAAAELALDSVIVERFALDSLSTPTVVQDYAFELSKDGWVSGGAPIVFSPPDYIYSGGALELRATTNTNTFGFWVNDPVDITIEADRLYRGTFEIRTDVTNPALVPEMRLRLNAGNFQASHSFGISSAGDGANSPGITNTVYDRLYFLPPASCVGEALIVSFDMLNFSPDDAADASLILERALIEALIPPTSP